MSFWDTTDNKGIDTSKKDFDAGGGNFEPLPDGTKVLAAAEEAGWVEFGADRMISVTWLVLKPAEYANRKIFHKIKVYGTSRDKDPKKTADKAKRMLAAIDANANGGLVAAGQEPTDEDLTRALVNKPMVLKLGVWELETDEGVKKTGNWVQAVQPRNSSEAGAPPPPPKPGQAKAHAKPAAATTDDDGFVDDDHPF